MFADLEMINLNTAEVLTSDDDKTTSILNRIDDSILLEDNDLFSDLAYEY